MRIVLAGASGFIGRELAAAYRAAGATVHLIGRHGPDARWGQTAAITDLVDGADVVVNMAGKSVNCRYTPENRAEIVRSRVETTRELAEAVANAENPPPLWINSSTATIYRHAEDRPQTESDGEIGSGFSVEVAKAWEAAFFERHLPGTRRVALRTAIVLGDGSVMAPSACSRASDSGEHSSTAGGLPPRRGGRPAPSMSSARAEAASGSAGCTWMT